MPTQEKKQGKPSNRGFAAMDQQKQREIASRGGVAAHKNGTAHEFTHEEAVAAGRKGGQSRSKSISSSRSAHNSNDQDGGMREISSINRQDEPLDAMEDGSS